MEKQSILEKRLVAELGWLQELARSLIRDPGMAEDVVQDVMVAGLETRRVAPRQEIRRDLFNKLRTRIFNKRREAARRIFREQDYAATRSRDSAHGATGVVSEADTADLLMREVMALSESHRAILLLCYFEGRPQREVAATLGVTDEAVRARLTRARAALRQRLDASSGGGREAWLPAVSALAGRAPAAQGSVWLSTWAAVLGWSGMKVAIATAVAALMGAVLWQLPRAESPLAPVVELAGGSDAAELADAPELPAPSQAVAAERLALGVPSGPVDAGVNDWLSDLLPVTTTQLISGRVVKAVEGDAHMPVEGAAVRVLSQSALEGLNRDPDFPVITAATQPDGTFELELPSFCVGVLEVTYPSMQRTFAWFPDQMSDAASSQGESATLELDEDIVLVASEEVTGRVQDAQGRLIAGVQVNRYHLQDERLGAFDNELMTSKVALLGEAGDDGRFRVLHTLGADRELYFTHPGYLPKLATPLISDG